MESGAKWAAFVTGVALLAIAFVLPLRDWLQGAAIGWGAPATLAVLGALALAVGLSQAPLDPRAARKEDEHPPGA